MTREPEKASGPPDDDGATDEVRTGRELAAFRVLATALAEERDLESVFHLIVETLSGLTGAARCSLHLLDQETGLLHGKAAHASSDIDMMVKQLVSGMPGDDFTREILETRRPVMLTDTRLDPRPVQAAMLRWRARSVLGVPMVLRGDVVGILCLDTEDTTAEFSQLDQELAISFAELAATAINQVQLTAQLRSSLQTQARQLEMLQRARRMEGQLADILLRGWGVRELADAMTKLLLKPCGIYDADLRCLTRSSEPQEGRVTGVGSVGQYPQAEELLKAMETGRIHYLDSAPQAGFADRLLVVPIDLSGERYGYIVVAEAGGRFGTFEEVIVRRAAHNMALERSRSRLEGEMEWHVVESFTASLIRGDHREVEALAKSLGIEMNERHVVCLVAARDLSVPVRATPQQVAQLLTVRESPSAVLAARIGAEIAVILTVPRDLDPLQEVEWARERMTFMLDTLSLQGELCASISAPESDAANDPRAYREARQTLRCLREHVSDALPGVLTVDDLGAARLMLASASCEEARQFAEDALGPLISDRSAKSEELLWTLESFLRHSRGVRDCADDLGVHPNTVRYRLAGVERLTRLAVTTDDDDYMAAQMAVTIVRLSGQLSDRAYPAVAPVDLAAIAGLDHSS